MNVVIFIPVPLRLVVHKSAVIEQLSLVEASLYESAPALIPDIVNCPSALYGFTVADVYGFPSVILTLNVFCVSGAISE